MTRGEAASTPQPSTRTRFRRPQLAFQASSALVAPGTGKRVLQDCVQREKAAWERRMTHLLLLVADTFLVGTGSKRDVLGQVRTVDLLIDGFLTSNSQTL